MPKVPEWYEIIADKDAEIARLRAALRNIIDLGGAYGSAEYARQADRIARAALEGK